MKNFLRFLVGVAAVAWLLPAWAVVNVFATVPEWGALAQELGGDKVKPQAIEEVLTAFGPVGQAAAFTQPNALGIDEVWALVVPNGPLDESALRAHCQQRLPIGCVPVRFVSVERLPRNENGKIERHLLRDAVGMAAG